MHRLRSAKARDKKVWLTASKHSRMTQNVMIQVYQCQRSPTVLIGRGQRCGARWEMRFCVAESCENKQSKNVDSMGGRIGSG